MSSSGHRRLARSFNLCYRYTDNLTAFNNNKKLYRAFSQLANGLTLNISVLQGLLRVNGKAEKDS